MPKTHVIRSTTINSPIENVYSKLNDLNHWRAWSPWLIMEQGVDVNVSSDGKFYEWKGSRVGEGNMNITLEDGNNSIEYDLNFLKPWKSDAKVKFLLSDNGDRTIVTWTMDSSLPWFMFFMKGMMEGFIGMDFQRGLNMLTDYVEEGEVKSKLEFVGESDFAGAKYIGLKTICPMSELSTAMSKDFGKLYEFAEKYPALSKGQLFSIYHKWDVTKQKTIYTGCIYVSDFPENLSSEFITGEIPAIRIYTIRHIGPYHHLGNAWSSLMNMERSKEFKRDKKIDPFEIYISDPSSTPENEIITDVCFAIK